MRLERISVVRILVVQIGGSFDSHASDGQFFFFPFICLLSIKQMYGVISSYIKDIRSVVEC